MALIVNGNWSFRDPGEEVPDGSVIESGNFQQAVPDTPILVGKSLVINGGNWVNVRVDPAWTINDGNFAQISRCSHLHSGWGLAACPENCSHVVDTDEIWIDGVLIDTIYHYEDTVQ